ncbi:MAG TPA: transcriptional regulator [Polyangia bacterium]|nr:transcriptional regulator [Polyangia bacterium]
MRALALSLLLAATAAFADEPLAWLFTGPVEEPKLADLGYEGGVDATHSHSGRRSVFLRSLIDKPRKHAVVMQSIAADRYRGRRVRLSAWVLTDGRARPWIGINVTTGETSVGRVDIPVSASGGWQREEAVVDVAASAQTLHFGMLLGGPGQAWLDDVRLEVVGDSVPATGPRLPFEPRNLDFEE